MATYIEVKKQIEELQQQAETLRAQERSGVIERMKEAIEVYEITAEELGFSRGPGKRGPAPGSTRATGKKATRKTKAAVAYADDKGNTWVGRGPRPKWLKDALEGGAKLEDFAKGRF